MSSGGRSSARSRASSSPRRRLRYSSGSISLSEYEQVVFELLAPQRGLAQEPPLELLGVARILQPQRVERLLDLLLPPVQDLLDQVADPPAEDAQDAPVGEGMQLRHQDARVDEQLEPVRDLQLQRRRDPEPPMQRLREAKPFENASAPFDARL